MLLEKGQTRTSCDGGALWWKLHCLWFDTFMETTQPFFLSYLNGNEVLVDCQWAAEGGKAASGGQKRVAGEGCKERVGCRWGCGWMKMTVEVLILKSIDT